MENQSHSDSYKAAGVDVVAGYRAVELMKSHVERTKIPGVLDSIGGFGGLFMPSLAGMKEPVLVSGTDGVGTKLQIALELDRHDTIGIDSVAMCVNDIICCGARPLFFLDYIACGKNFPEKIASIIKGVADGCEQSGCALVGGETAEHPGVMPEHEYDIAGFSVGIVDKSKILDKNSVCEGDTVIGIASSGVHSNGFSLVRKIMRDNNLNASSFIDELGCTIGEALLVPTRIYVKPVLALLESVDVKSISHITGGGFYENIPRALPSGYMVEIQRDALEILPIFKVLAGFGNIPERDMFNTFNMGVGMTIVVSPENAEKAVESLNASGEKAKIIGKVCKGELGMVLA